jgi:hypothetical protein
MTANKPGSSGPPGYDYAYRIVDAWQKAMAAQGAIATDAWNQMKTGTFKFSSGMKWFAESVEAYYGVVLEAWRGPEYVREPVWLHFDYDQKTKKPSALESTVALCRPEAPSTTLNATDFASMSGGSTLQPFYADYSFPDAAHATVKVTLNVTKVSGAPPGQYVSFILADNRGGEPPLVIVLLRISPP